MSVTPSKISALVTALTNKFAAINHTHSGYQETLVSGSNIKTVNNNSLLGSGNITISGGGGSDGEYFFTKDSFFDPNQWTGSPTISNGTITLEEDSTFPLRLPPNCSLSFDLTVTSGYDEIISTLGTDFSEVNYDWLTAGVADINFTATNNRVTIWSDETGDETQYNNVSSRTGLSIPVTSGCTATISNVVFTDNNRVTGSGGGGSVDIVTSWSSTTSDTKVPSEKLSKNSLDAKVNTSDIADNLTTNDATKVLSAKQGKALNDLIGTAISYINQ